MGDDADVAMTRGASCSKTESIPRVHHHLTEWCSLLVVLCVTPNGAGAAATGTGGSGATGGTGDSNPAWDPTTERP